MYLEIYYLTGGPLGPCQVKRCTCRPAIYVAGWLCEIFHVEQIQLWQQPRSQNIVTPAQARIVNEAGILRLPCALQSPQNGEGLNPI